MKGGIIITDRELLELLVDKVTKLDSEMTSLKRND